jgi:hypothetical protein
MSLNRAAVKPVGVGGAELQDRCGPHDGAVAESKTRSLGERSGTAGHSG